MTARERARPVCELCTRNARTVDMPRIIVRVEHAIVMRPSPLTAPHLFHGLCRCHGSTDRIVVEWGVLGERMGTEGDVENLAAFQKERS